MSIGFLKNKKMTCSFNPLEFSYDITLGYSQNKALPPSAEATHDTLNTSYLDNFQNLFTPILYHMYVCIFISF